MGLWFVKTAILAVMSYLQIINMSRKIYKIQHQLFLG